ncbi:MAG: endopeptidase La [Planctomycetota bacterium]|nr:endopeptidase La [Planctomycetota bacterium]
MAKQRARRKKQTPARRPKVEELEVVIVPVRNMVLFPGVVLPLMIGREPSVLAVQAAVEASEPVGLLLQRDESLDSPAPSDLYTTGTLAQVVRYWQTPDGQHHAICQGESRFQVIKFVSTEPFPRARVRVIPPASEAGRRVGAQFVALKQRAQEVLELAPGAPEEMAQTVQAIESPAMLADMVSTFVDVPPADKQALLETFDLVQRLDQLNHLLGEWSEVLQLSHKIRQDTRGSLDQAQREYFLREQLRTIQRELGELDDKAEDTQELRATIDALDLPEAAEAEVRKELRRLERTPEQAAEYSMLRTWLELFTELPWNEASVDNLNLEHARAILDEDHYGLEMVKRRILEFLAVRKLNPKGQGRALCLVGPPGVGKTSLGRSVARAIDRKFVRVSLGGVHDEGEVRGHRRTYIGAMPGRILDGLRRGGTNNPVFLLDEMDKLGASSLHGDPSSGMLEVLDPAQNHTFVDNYLGVPFDLSRVLFIATANVLESIPGALRDRLEVLYLPGYTEEEKLEIARRYLVRRQLEACGLTSKRVKIRVPALRELIRYDTREAGVRGLERQIGALCRHGATLFAGRRRKPLVIDVAVVREILGPRRYERDVALRTSQPGVSTGLAWTPVGGEILFIEVTRMPGKGGLRLTGQLGDVMQESAQAALSLVRTRAAQFGVDEKFFATRDLHLHLPAGAVPKDGPSAGVAMFVALVSLLTDRCVKPTVAMTGEISLRGLVLPVGGIKEKVLAARAAGIKTVLLPRRNRPDFLEIPERARKGLDAVYLETVDDALEAALLRTR